MEFYIVSGIIKKWSKLPTEKLIGLTDFLYIIKQVLTRLNVQFTDPCCPNTGFSPVRRNNTTNTLQYFNYATQTWVAYVPTP